MAKTSATKTKDVKPLIEVLQSLNCDGTLKSRAFTFLRLDLSQLQTDQQFREAFAGLVSAQQLLGPLSANYRQTLDDLRKVLTEYHKAHRWMLPDEVVGRLEVSWKALCEVFKAHVPGEIWEEIEQTTLEAFLDVRSTINRSKS